ncbi:MAG: 3-hydroxyacyl-ACP dehydratase FabZ family protein [Planctomycetota bacterium]
MATGPWVDPTELDFDHVAVPEDRLRRHLPQRHEFQLLDRVCLVDVERKLLVGYKDLTPEDWWARGHFPGRPLFPGVLMLEGAAHAATVLWREHSGIEDDTLIGFGGVEHVRYRGQVVPPGRIVFVSQGGMFRRRIARMPTQALYEGQVVFEAEILGVTL